MNIEYQYVYKKVHSHKTIIYLTYMYFHIKLIIICFACTFAINMMPMVISCIYFPYKDKPLTSCMTYRYRYGYHGIILWDYGCTQLYFKAYGYN